MARKTVDWFSVFRIGFFRENGDEHLSFVKVVEFLFKFD